MEFVWILAGMSIILYELFKVVFGDKIREIHDKRSGYNLELQRLIECYLLDDLNLMRNIYSYSYKMNKYEIWEKYLSASYDINKKQAKEITLLYYSNEVDDIIKAKKFITKKMQQYMALRGFNYCERKSWSFDLFRNALSNAIEKKNIEKKLMS